MRYYCKTPQLQYPVPAKAHPPHIGREMFGQHRHPQAKALIFTPIFYLTKMAQVLVTGNCYRR